MRFTLAAFVALIHAGSAAVANTKMDVEAEIGVHVSADLNILSCDNKGPKITFGGIVATENVDATLTFSNNMKCRKSRTETVETATFELSTEEEFSFAKQPPQGGVGGNPHIWFQPGNSDEEIYLGRCVQGAKKIEYDTLVDALGEFYVDAENCINSGGPQITLEGEFTIASNIEGTFKFKNSKKNPQHIREEDGDLAVSITLLEAGEKIFFPKQPVQGGVGGNPHIWLTLNEEVNLCEDYYLGRCNKL